MTIDKLWDLLTEMKCCNYDIMLVGKDGAAVPLSECRLRKCNERKELYISNDK